MKTTIFINIVLLVLIVSGCSKEKSPEEIVRAYIDAQNSHDIDKKLKYFDEETAFITQGSEMNMMGPEDIRRMSQYDSVLNTVLTIDNLRVDGTTIICKITEHNRWLDAAGLPPLQYDSTLFYVIGDKIRKVVSFPDSASLEGMTDVLNKFIPWLAEKYPYETTVMIPNGQFEYSAENAEKLLAYLREWRRTTEED